MKKTPPSPFDLHYYGKEAFALKVGYYQLWFEYLAMSPSYELARRCRAKVWTHKERASKPADFDRVLEVYDDLDDVRRILFETWWRERGLKHFGYQGKRPSVEKVADVERSNDKEPYLGDATKKFMDGPWREQGRQRTMIIAIPIDMPRGRIIKQVKALLGKNPADEPTLHLFPADYPLVDDKKLYDKAFIGYLKALWARCANPKDHLWEIGAEAKIGETYKRLSLNAVRNDSTAGDMDTLKTTTHRAIDRGKMIAENAARGIFPSFKECPNAIPFDFKALGKMRANRIDWQKANGENLDILKR